MVKLIMIEMQIDKEKINKLEKLLKDSGVVLAYIFGSYARETAGPMSDLDVAIIFSDAIPQNEYFKRELKIAGDAESALGIKKVDIVNLATVTSPLLKHEAVFHGKLIFTGDRKLKFATESFIMKESEDTKHLREAQFDLMKRRLTEGRFASARLRSKYMEKYVTN